jgi:hypothetical protein
VIEREGIDEARVQLGVCLRTILGWVVTDFAHRGVGLVGLTEA